MIFYSSFNSLLNYQPSVGSNKLFIYEVSVILFWIRDGLCVFLKMFLLQSTAGGHGGRSGHHAQSHVALGF